MSPRRILVALLVISWAGAADYDPLLPTIDGAAAELRLAIDAAAGSTRRLPLRIVLPPGAGPVPVVLFSHGLGGSCEGNEHLRHWAARGYAVVYLQHPGSDESVWKEVPPAQRLAAMNRAVSAANLALRIADVRSVLDRLVVWQAETGHALAGRLDLGRVGMSGHSFGAMTTQAVSGHQLPGGLSALDPRIRAAVIFSPSPPPRGGDPAQAFAGVAMPWLLMTGTHDQALFANITPADRLCIFPALPAGMAYELVLDKAEHSVFTDRALPGDRLRRDPNHHRSILAVTTAFWDAFLRQDAAARAWLDGDGPRRVLAAADRWQRK